VSEVLAARIAIGQGLKKWESIAVVAKKLVEWNPGEPSHSVDLAYATRRAESLDAAHAVLKRAEELHVPPVDAPGQALLAA
jgi:hypothetical protein